MIAAFTGHRPNKLGAYYSHMPQVRWVLFSIDDALTHLRPDRVISGMALGVDTWAAQIALKRGIPVTAAVPCDDQERLWPDRDQRIYRELLTQCDVLIAVWDGSPGGTGNCVRYAEKKRKPIYRIVP